MLLEKLKGVAQRFEEVARLITDPDIINDMQRYIRLNKEYKDLQPVVDAYHEYDNIISNIESTKALLEHEKDAEMREMAKMELDELIHRRHEMEEEVKFLLLPADPE
ncbi:MAG: PCRF domain-containing protein, partial [Bacteroidales bacterium]|nr:PCRF domain-containing protein [Bacteroidales bacterium]